MRTFKNELTKVVKTKIDGKVIQLKEERSLFSRFLITSRKRPEIDLESCLGNYEFSVVPKSLFTSDGEPLPCTDKSKLLHEIENCTQGDTLRELHPPEERLMSEKTIVIDAMAVVNQLNKGREMRTYAVSYIQFSSLFQNSLR